MTILELREKRAKAWAAAKAFLDSHRNEKGVLSAEDDAAYTKMEQDITNLGNTAGVPVVCKLLFDGEMDFTGAGAWLPVLTKDGIPAYIKAKTTE